MLLWVKNTEKMRYGMNTAQLLVDCLEQEGVKYIFGIPGEENLAVIEALAHSSIRFITTRHEQGAAFMADVYGRLTGRAGVCLATLGPGATNLITGVADANSDGAPLVAITGQVGTDKMHITSHQFLDLTKMFEPLTKRTKLVVRPDTVPEIVRLAFKYAEGGKPGATHIDLPVNVAQMEVPEGERPMPRVEPIRGMADLAAVEEAAGLIFRAQSPVILVGSEAVHAGAAKALCQMAEKLHIPVINTMMAKGMIPYDNKYALWTIGIPQRDYANKVIEHADVVITIGYDIVEYMPRHWNPNRSATIIHINTDRAHINKYYQVAVEVVGDISESIYAILRRTTRHSEPEYALKIREKIVAEHESYANDDAFPMKPQRILYDVRKVMAPGDIVLSDVGAHKMWIARHYNCYEPNSCIISNGFATMGIAVPGAITAKLVHPEKRVLVITGDGGFMMNCQEFETARRERTPFVTLIFNDQSYGLIKWKQMDQYGESHFTDFTNPDFVKFAESMYAKGYRIERAADLIPTLQEAFTLDVPAIIDCRVDYGENTKLTEHLRQIYAQQD